MKVLIAGLGAIGSIYATKLKEFGVTLKVLTDAKRYERYKKNGLIFNGKRYDFDYILPTADNFSADLIIIAVKAYNLDEIIKNIKNFVSKKTIIISLLNGISSEDVLRKAYPQACVLDSYYVGHASMKRGNEVTYDGIGKIVFCGNECIETLFKRANIEYEIPKDMFSSMWQKFIINIGVNQTTAILKEPYSCFKRADVRATSRKLMEEGVAIAKLLGVAGADKFIENTFKLIDDMPSECKTSMMQDIEQGKRTEVDIFAGEICKLGEKYGVKTPENKRVYKEIKQFEKNLD